MLVAKTALWAFLVVALLQVLLNVVFVGASAPSTQDAGMPVTTWVMLAVHFLVHYSFWFAFAIGGLVLLRRLTRLGLALIAVVGVTLLVMERQNLSQAFSEWTSNIRTDQDWGIGGHLFLFTTYSILLAVPLIGIVSVACASMAFRKTYIERP
jgi:hypothetical protein